MKSKAKTVAVRIDADIAEFLKLRFEIRARQEKLRMHQRAIMERAGWVFHAPDSALWLQRTLERNDADGTARKRRDHAKHDVIVYPGGEYGWYFSSAWATCWAKVSRTCNPLAGRS